MSEILQPHRVDAGSTYDIVNLYLGTHKLNLFYQSAFEIVNSIRMASKLSMRHEGNQIPDWREILKSVQSELPKRVKRHQGFRRSNETSNVKKWSVAWEGALVILTFDELTCKMHYSDGLRLHALLRQAAKNAQAWAGDETKAMRMTAYLNDAEENYKHGYAV